LARHHASHVPCDVSSRRCFLLQMQAVLSWATHVDGRLLHHFSGIHTPALCYQLPSSPLCAFLGFLLLRHYVRMSTTLPSVVFYTGVDALRQLVTMQPWPPSLPAEAHKCRLSPSTYLPCRSGTPAVSRLHVFLRSGSSVERIREEYDTCVE